MKALNLMQVWFILSLISCSIGARILAVLPFAFKSHHMFFQTVLKELALKGHQVVVYSPFPQQHPLPNYTDVYVNTSISETLILDYETLLGSVIASKTMTLKDIWSFLNKHEEEALKHENIQKLAKSEEKFDLVITEAFVTQETFLAFGYKFNAPTIAIQSLMSFNIVDKVMGNSLALSYSPSDLYVAFSNKMSFLERLVNVYSSISVLYSFYNEYIPSKQGLVNRYLKFPNAPQLSDMIHNISLVLFNHQVTVNYPRPFPPNFIPLGGIHISNNRKPLPKDMQMFMDEATHGVIYFSLGTIVPDDVMPQEYFTKFIKVFEKLKQRVIWKTRRDKIPGIPNNVMIVKWAPQLDLLGHSNCVLFITHGGLLSQQEVIHAGVPVVAIPFFGDQRYNVRFYVEKGIGVKLDFVSLSEESIYTTINTVLSNPLYKENAVKLSQIVRDQPMNQKETAVFWVEYVLRHKGAHHLRSASANMSWYQLALLDVLAVIVLAVVLAVVAVYWSICRISSKICNSKKKHSSNKKTN